MGAEAVTLDETAFSDIDDDALYQEIYDTAYHGVDIRPAWIGAHRPRTSVENLRRIASWASTHYDYYLNFVREYMERRGDVLDIGCGAGQATAMLARYSENAVGVDSDATVFEFAVKHNGGAAYINAPFPYETTRTFDYIFCVETMEHIPYEQQEAFIDKALAMLRPDGRMFITTPNESSASPPHVGVWSPQVVEALANRLGDRIVRRTYFSNGQPTEFFSTPSTHHAWVLR